MDRIFRLSLLGLCLFLLAGCAGAGAVSRHSHEALAGQVPGETENLIFLDLKPEGQVGRDWERVVDRLRQIPEGRDALDNLLASFEVDVYPLEGLVSGIGASGYWNRVYYAILQLDDAEAVRQAMHSPEVGVTWTEEEYGGRRLYEGRLGPGAPGSARFVAWSVAEDLLFLVSSSFNSPLPQLKELLDLPEAESLAALPAWQTLGDRLPEEAVALYFINVAAQAPAVPPPAGAPRGELLAANVEALALAAVPDEHGLRIQIEGSLVDGAGGVPEIQALYDLEAVDPDAWPGLPSGTAVAIISHDASTAWPWARELLTLNTNAFSGLYEGMALDVEADLLGPEGPLTGPFAIGILPPLPDQPVSGEIPAGQVLFLAPQAGSEDAARLRAVMEGRGATFGAVELDDMELQRQVGTGPSGYAVTYALEEGVLTIGSSPTVVSQAVHSTRRHEGLVQEEAYRRAAAAIPRDPFFFAYLSTPALLELSEANNPAGAPQAGELALLEPFEAMAFGIRLNRSEIQGAIYLSLAGE